ncbi:MAG: hypothetical protein HY347_07365 [candidate division NC10 bacterium]|nr:hypothetical protein [candidate division NC10 bacterium]
MMTRRLRILGALVLFLVGLTGLDSPSAAEVAGPPVRVINVERGSISLKTLEANRGDTVVWHNVIVPPTFMNVIFDRGREVQRASDSPTRFQSVADGTYRTGPMSTAETASLRFHTAGTYRYRVMTIMDTEVEMEGTIVVK